MWKNIKIGRIDATSNIETIRNETNVETSNKLDHFKINSKLKNTVLHQIMLTFLFTLKIFS
jgi:hypothetical protein